MKQTNKLILSNLLALLCVFGFNSAMAGVAVPPGPSAGSDCFAGGFSPSPGLNSRVLDDVFFNGSTHEYDFTVCNMSVPQLQDGDEILFGALDLIRDWELPLFGDEGITGILTPTGWSWSIETIGEVNGATGWDGVADWQTAGDPQKDIFDALFGGEANNPYNFNTEVLHFYTNDVAVYIPPDCGFFELPDCGNNFLEGFGFTADFGQTDAPYQASWDQGQIQTGDPAFPLGGGVGSPLAQSRAQVPEPGPLLLMLTGGFMLIGARKLRLS